MRTVIIVAPNAFHLGWMGATHRLMHVANSLGALGFTTILIAGAMTEPLLQKEIDQYYPGKIVRLSHTGDYPFFFDISHTLRRAWRGVWKLRGENFYHSELSWGWCKRLDVNLILKKLYNMKVTPELLWGVSAGKLDGATAAQHISKALNLPWIFELHDPPVGAGVGADNIIVRKHFSELIKSATRIVVTSNDYANMLGKEHIIQGDKIHTIHLGYEENQIVENNDNANKSCFTLAYAGSLNGGRTLEPLLKAIALTFKENQHVRENFKLEIAGTGTGYKEVDHISSSLGLTDTIISHGLLNPTQVHSLINRAVALVVLENKSPMQVPGKIFECLKSEKPIIGIMPNNCEASKILVNSGLGFIHESNDIHGISRALIAIWKAWHNNQIICKPNYSFIRKYSTSQLPQKLSHVLSGVI